MDKSSYSDFDGLSTVPQRTLRTRISTLLVAGVAFTSSWTDVSAGGVLKISDVICIIALTLLPWKRAIEHFRYIHGAWSFAPLFAILFVFTVQVVLFGEPPGEGVADLARAFFGLTAVVLMASSLLDGSSARLLLVLRAWVLGAGVNALSVWLVQIGVLTAGWRPTDLNTLERAIGLAFHPNSLAFSIIAVIPVAFYLFYRASRARAQLFWTVVLALLINALFQADSRAGLLLGLLVTSIGLVLVLAYSRFRLATLPALIVIPVLLATIVIPYLSSSTRLSEGAGALSDLGREVFNAEGLTRFGKNPWVGAGFDEAIGTSMYVHLLSETGLVGAVGYFLFVMFLGRLIVSSASGLSRWLGLLSLVAVLGFGIVQPGMTERTTYWGVVLIALLALKESAISRSDETAEGSPSMQLSTRRNVVRRGVRGVTPLA